MGHPFSKLSIAKPLEYVTVQNAVEIVSIKFAAVPCWKIILSCCAISLIHFFEIDSQAVVCG